MVLFNVNHKLNLEVTVNDSDQNQPQASHENIEMPKTLSKKIWVAPKVETIEFMDTAASFAFPGIDGLAYSST